MADVDGSWDTVTKSPMGKRAALITILSSGETLSGHYSGAMGESVIETGTVTGNSISFTIEVSRPMRMTLDVDATVDGDAISGTVKAGSFGSFPLTGTRSG